jgi:hypothetical protein
MCLNHGFVEAAETSAEVYCVLSSRKLTMHISVSHTNVASRANLSNPSFVPWLSSFNTRYWYLHRKLGTMAGGCTILALVDLRRGMMGVQSVHSTESRAVPLKWRFLEGSVHPCQCSRQHNSPKSFRRHRLSPRRPNPLTNYRHNHSWRKLSGWSQNGVTSEAGV